MSYDVSPQYIPRLEAVMTIFARNMRAAMTGHIPSAFRPVSAQEFGPSPMLLRATNHKRGVLIACLKQILQDKKLGLVVYTRRNHWKRVVARSHLWKYSVQESSENAVRHNIIHLPWKPANIAPAEVPVPPTDNNTALMPLNSQFHVISMSQATETKMMTFEVSMIIFILIAGIYLRITLCCCQDVTLGSGMQPIETKCSPLGQTAPQPVPFCRSNRPTGITIDPTEFGEIVKPKPNIPLSTQSVLEYQREMADRYDEVKERTIASYDPTREWEGIGRGVSECTQAPGAFDYFTYSSNPGHAPHCDDCSTEVAYWQVWMTDKNQENPQVYDDLKVFYNHIASQRLKVVRKVLQKWVRRHREHKKAKDTIAFPEFDPDYFPQASYTENVNSLPMPVIARDFEDGTWDIYIWRGKVFAVAKEAPMVRGIVEHIILSYIPPHKNKIPVLDDNAQPSAWFVPPSKTTVSIHEIRYEKYGRSMDSAYGAGS